MGRKRRRHQDPPPPAAPPVAERPDRSLLLLALILLLALALRLHHFTYNCLWLDEANGVLFAQASLGEIPSLLAGDAHPPLYYFLLHFWMLLFGAGEIAVRSLSLLCGLLLIAGVYLWGRRIFTPGLGLAAAFYLAITPIQVFHSRQARMYTLLPLLALMALGHLWLYLDRQRRRDLVLFCLFLLAALFTHYFALHLLPVCGLLVLLSGRLKVNRYAWLVAGVVILAVGLLWLPNFLAQAGLPGQNAWIAPTKETWNLLQEPWHSLLSYSPGGEHSAYGGHRTDLWRGWPPLALTTLGEIHAPNRQTGLHWVAMGSSLLALTGIVRLRRGRRTWGRTAALLPPLWLLLPMASATVATRLPGVPAHYIPGRVDQLMLPAFALLTGHGLLVPGKAWLRGGLVVVLLAVSLLTLSRFNIDPTKVGVTGNPTAGQEREAVAKIAELHRPGDVVLCTGWSNRSTEYYMQRQGIRGEPITFLPFIPDFSRDRERRLQRVERLWRRGAARKIKARLRPGGMIYLLFLVEENIELALKRLKQKKLLLPIVPIEHYILAGIFHRLILVKAYIP